MNIGLLLPGFSRDETDHAIPVQDALVRALARQDDVRVLALRYPHYRGRYGLFGAEVTALGAAQGRGMRRLALWLDALRTLREMHREKPFDVLHAMWADETGLIAGWAGRWLRVPIVVSVLGGELARLDDLGYGLQRGAFSRWIVGKALAHADAVVTAGHYAKAMIDAAGYAVSPRKLRVLPLGVDTACFHPTDNTRQESRLLHVASLVGVKDQATLLRALARLPASVSLDIIGDGTEREALMALARQLGIAERVRFLGAVAHTELPQHYLRAALHVMASRSEALPIAVLEAAACGLYTVCTAAGALPEYPTLATTVPIGDDAALANAISDLLAHPARRAELGAQAARAVREHFTIEGAAARLRSLYNDLLDQRF